MENQSDEVMEVEVDPKVEEGEEDEEGPPPGYQTILKVPKIEAELPCSPPTVAKLEAELPHSPSTMAKLEAELPHSPPTMAKLEAELPHSLQTAPKLEAEPLSRSQPPQTATATANTSELAQLVCGSCRRLLGYPLGSLHVQCSCCQVVNFVLQAHQVGQVKCKSCTVLLMYPYGASQVKCCSCQSVTEIGQHNHRPPLSAQLRRQLPCLKSSN